VFRMLPLSSTGRYEPVSGNPAASTRFANAIAAVEAISLGLVVTIFTWRPF
jgi:hypothetical protein